MNKFKSFDEQKFFEAINTKDYRRLKTDMGSAMINDPTFCGHEVEGILSILEKECKDIFEEEYRLPIEEHLPESKWDEDYFVRMTLWLRENFAKSRIEEIKKVGRKVYGEREKQVHKSQGEAKSEPEVNTEPKCSDESVKYKQEKNTQKANPPKPPKQKYINLAIGIAAVVAIVALVAVVVIKHQK